MWARAALAALAISLIGIAANVADIHVWQCRDVGLVVVTKSAVVESADALVRKATLQREDTFPSNDTIRGQNSFVPLPGIDMVLVTREASIRINYLQAGRQTGNFHALVCSRRNFLCSGALIPLIERVYFGREARQKVCSWFSTSILILDRRLESFIFLNRVQRSGERAYPCSTCGDNFLRRSARLLLSSVGLLFDRIVHSYHFADLQGESAQSQHDQHNSYPFPSGLAAILATILLAGGCGLISYGVNKDTEVGGYIWVIFIGFPLLWAALWLFLGGVLKWAL